MISQTHNNTHNIGYLQHRPTQPSIPPRLVNG